MEVLINGVELRNRVVWTRERKYVKRDGTEGVVKPRPYFTVDCKDKNGVMNSNMIYLSEDKVSILESKINGFPDHAKLTLNCVLESSYDGQFRVVCYDLDVKK